MVCTSYRARCQVKGLIGDYTDNVVGALALDPLVVSASGTI